MDVFELLLIAIGGFFAIGVLLAIIATRAWIFLIPIALLFLVNSYPTVSFFLLFLFISSVKYLAIKEKGGLTPQVFLMGILATSAGYSAVAIAVAMLLGEFFSGFGATGGIEVCTRSYCP